MSAMIGAISIVIADLIGRTLFLPKEVPAGVFIAAFGAPFFIYLLLTVKSYNDIIKTNDLTTTLAKCLS